MQLTLAEYTANLNKVMKAFAASQTTAWEEQVYAVKKNYDRQKAKRLFLFCYALDTWVHSDSAINYLTEDQVMSIISKANR